MFIYIYIYTCIVDLMFLLAIQKTVLNNNEEHITISRLTYILCTNVASTAPLRAAIFKPSSSGGLGALISNSK